MTSVDVSIIIPSYNRLWSLPKTIASCTALDCVIEIIVIDDGSADGTWEWLVNQENIVSIYQENLGKDWAVNRGFAIAQGQYVKFLDSDDRLIPGVLDKQYQLARSTGADVVVAGYEVMDDHGFVTKTQSYVHTDDFIAQQLGESDGSHYSAFLFKKEFITHIPHRQEYGVRDDRMFILEVALKNPQVTVFQPPAIQLLHHQFERLQFPKGLREPVANYYHLQIYKRIIGLLARRNELTERRRKAACRVLWPLAHWIALSHLDEACEVAEWIYQLDPDFQPLNAGLLGKIYELLGFQNTENLLRFRRNILSFFAPNSSVKLHSFPA